MGKTKLNDPGFWNTPLTRSSADKQNVKLPEMLFGYLVGPFGAAIASGIFGSILQNYFTDVLKLDLVFLTTLQLFSTVLIVALNLVIGQMIERTRCLAGKARPWILLSALAVSVTSVLMFIVPFEGAAKMVWITIAYNLFYAFAWPIYSTANATLIAVSTRDSQKRGLLASLGNVAGLGAMGVGSIAFPTLVSAVLKEDQFRWFFTMLILAIFTALTVFLQYKFTRERVTEELMAVGEDDDGSKKAAAPIGQQLKAVTSEKWWWIIILFYLGFQWAGAMKNCSMAYFCKWVIDNSFFGVPLDSAWGMSQSLLAILGALPMAVAAVLVVPLSNKFSKRVVCIVGMLVGAVGGVIAGLGNGQIIPVAVGVAIKCLGSAPACYMIIAMLADVIDHIEFKHGIRTDGLTMSIYSSILVAGTPICNAIFSALLNAGGYDQSASVALGIAGQAASAQGVISIAYIWVETVAYVVCAGLMLVWTVEKKLPEEQKAIAERKSKA